MFYNFEKLKSTELYLTLPYKRLVQMEKPAKFIHDKRIEVL